MKILTTVKEKIEIIIAAIAGLFSVFLFFFVKQKISAHEHLKNELDKVMTETNVAKQESDSKERKQKLEKLKEDELTIREKIDVLNKMETEQKRDVSIEELDAFFDQRGF